MPLNPPFCLEVLCDYIQDLGDNLYKVKLTQTGPQKYGNGEYTCENIALGMWFSNLGNGYAWRIYEITNQNSEYCDCTIEDDNGYNALIDPSGGIDGGAPGSTIGYIYELNGQGLPVLTEVPHPPSIIWTDSQLARFLFNQTGISESFTIYVDFSNANSISRVYIPPGLFPDSTGLNKGGIYDSDQESYLVFKELQSITLNGTVHTMVSQFNVIGYLTTGTWQQVPGGNLSSTKINISIPLPNYVKINNFTLGNINGGNFAVKSTFPYPDFLASVTLRYVL
jgi:hypothetical protein